jgi:hypothetical protein
MLLCILTPVTTKQNIYRIFVLPGSQGEWSKKIRKKKGERSKLTRSLDNVGIYNSVDYLQGGSRRIHAFFTFDYLFISRRQEEACATIL